MNRSKSKSLSREATSLGDWPSRIAGAWTKAAAAILETGKLLNEAKRALAHGEFTRMLQSSDLPFSERTAQRLMAIARHPILSNPTHMSLLPPAWSTLSALCQLPGETLRLKFEGGAIHPGLRRAEVREWTQIVQEVSDGLPGAVGAARPLLEKTGDAPKVDDRPNLDTTTPTERLSPGSGEVVTEVKGMVDLNTAGERYHFGILCSVWDAASEDVRDRFLVRIDAEPVRHSPRPTSRPTSSR
jgi:hypothetical protein